MAIQISDADCLQSSIGEPSGVFAERFADLSGSLNAKYEILGTLGAGGMAVVYKARHRLTGQMVAIKVLHKQDETTLKRFAQEAKTATSLAHPNIVTVHDFDVLDDTVYLVMELVEGPSLAEVLRDEGPLSIDRFKDLIGGACEGLGYAHHMGVVHRDIKPSNILIKKIGDREVAKLADFGIAKSADDISQNLTQTGQIIGTPLYMSPEQCLGQSATARSDLYALGCVMYEALTGKAPLAGSNVMETAHLRLSQSPNSFAELKVSSIPASIENAVFACLERDPQLRTSSASNLLKHLSSDKTVRLRRGKFSVKSLAVKLVAAPIALYAIGLAGYFVYFCCEQATFPDERTALVALAKKERASGDIGKAARIYDKLVKLARKNHDKGWEATALTEAAFLEIQRKRFKSAEANLDRAMVAWTEFTDGKGPFAAYAHTTAAEAYIKLGKLALAETQLNQSRQILSLLRGREAEVERFRFHGVDQLLNKEKNSSKPRT